MDERMAVSVLRRGQVEQLVLSLQKKRLFNLLLRYDPVQVRMLTHAKAAYLIGLKTNSPFYDDGIDHAHLRHRI